MPLKLFNELKRNSLSYLQSLRLVNHQQTHWIIHLDLTLVSANRPAENNAAFQLSTSRSKGFGNM